VLCYKWDMDPTQQDYTTTTVVLYDLPRLLRSERTRRGLSLRDAAAEAGVGWSTLWRIEQGSEATTRHLLAAVQWLSDSWGQP
jgi:transcriptional regulator with XRE-family HTH domain